MGEHHTGAYENIPAPDIFIAKASALTSRIGARHRHHQPAVPRPVHGRRAARLPRPPHARTPDLRLRRRRAGERQAVLPGGRRGLAADARGARHHRAAVRDHRLRRLRRQVLAARPQAHPGAAVPGASAVLDRGHVGHAQLRAVRRARVRGAEHLLHAGADRGQPGDARPHRGGQRDRRAAEAAGRDPVRARNDWRICREVYVSDSKNAAMARSARPSSSRTTTCSRSGWRR